MYLYQGMVHIVHGPVHKKELIHLLGSFFSSLQFLVFYRRPERINKTQNFMKCHSSLESVSMERHVVNYTFKSKYYSNIIFHKRQLFE